jgi:peroxin-5
MLGLLVSQALIFRSDWLTVSSGLNIGAHKEAAEHFLSGIAMQEMTEGDTSDQLWFTLRRSLLAMVSILFFDIRSLNCVALQDRIDLAEKAQPAQKPHLDLFRNEGFDF